MTIDTQARDLLASEFEAVGNVAAAFAIRRCGTGIHDHPYAVALRAITAALSRSPLSREDGAVEALRWVARAYENPDINHLDFRVEAKRRAEAVLAALSRPIQSRDDVIEECVKTVHGELYPQTQEDDWTQYAVHSARFCRRAEKAIRALKTGASPTGELIG